MTTAEKFLNAFNTIERYLTQYNLNKGYASFSRLVDYAVLKDKVVAQYKDDLKQFAELRNAIVHNTRLGDNRVIAEPHEDVVKEIELIAEMLLHPTRAIEKATKKVVTFHINDLLTTVLSQINTSKFTQFPIYNGKTYVGLLTESGITRYFAANHQKDISTIKLSEVIAYEQKERAAFVGEGATEMEVVSMFKSYNEQNEKLEAVLITDTGNKDGKLIGLITLYDLLN
ncbi:CBS domain-containing protein [Macrococcoides goetzii]|nr:CBS domain-containing protein [Macrococcus goetzii]TDM39201.1 CBS domain-containing protein [Macrococcus goetzii]TDM40085.1 CBS domain-containing protein [Macrococcus goetzii]TDM45794.1 CBS domain-containing protein [Macrococcus goetzii]